MALFDLEEFVGERHAVTGPLGAFDHAVEAVRQWHVRRQTSAKLSRLNEHLRRDVGFEPADAYDPLNGGATALWKKAHLRPDIR